MMKLNSYTGNLNFKSISLKIYHNNDIFYMIQGMVSKQKILL